MSTTIKRSLKTVYPPMKGLLELWLLDAEGTLLKYVIDRNLVVNTGRELAAHEIGEAVNRIGVGTNGAAAEPEDVAPLTQQYAKAFSGVTYPDERTVRFAFTLTTNEFNGKTIREFGLLQSLGGNPETWVLFARRGEYDIAKTDAVQVQGAWTVTF